uniref:Transmembrane protein 81 n=1 Tax=Labrus bergylta TaxID=56723 RepID=A0A3Q3FWK3_9LABR
MSLTNKNTFFVFSRFPFNQQNASWDCQAPPPPPRSAPSDLSSPGGGGEVASGGDCGQFPLQCHLWAGCENTNPVSAKRWTDSHEGGCEQKRQSTGIKNKIRHKCRVRKVRCQESWQCGLMTMTVTSGERVEVDCVGDVMEATCKSCDAAPVSFSGTYCCDVRDASYRRVKRVYWGIRVLPVGVLNLNVNYLDQNKSDGDQNNPTMEELDYWTHIIFVRFRSGETRGVNVSVALCQPCDWLVSSPGCNPASRSMTAGIDSNPL